ncbi:hypothetical protein EVA_02490 [gut metagenome]|uniref:Uncharacterized protein n=1 Tax=gut metagenome TaxID=749906 RepID=J9GMX6_9ZZZZ
MGSNVTFLIFLLFEIQRVEENPFGGIHPRADSNVQG